MNRYSNWLVDTSRSGMRGRWPIDEWVADVAAFGLASRRSLSGLTVHKYAWTEFLSQCEEHRVLGLLAHAVRAGAVELEEYQVEALNSTLRTWLVHDLFVERSLLQSVDVLDAVGIPSRVLKGVALAHTVYEDPALRLFGDIDLLVGGADFSRAAAALMEGLAATRELPELRPGFDDRFGREILLRWNGVEVDLHRTLVDGPFGLSIPPADLMAGPRSFVVGGRTLQGLSDPVRFVHACYASVLGDWPPRRIAQRDVAELLVGSQLAGTIEAASVLETATRWRAAPVVALAVRRTVGDLGLEASHPIIDWALAYRPSLSDRTFLAAYRGPARGYTSQALSVFALPSWRDRRDFLAAILRPSREYVDARGFRRGDRLRKALGLQVARR